MKTIDINLIGDIKRTQKVVKKPVIVGQNQEITPKIRGFVISSVIGASAVFIMAFCIWLIIFSITQKAKSDLVNLQTEHGKLKIELAKSNTDNKNLLLEKTILNLKLVISNKISDSILPWHDILIDVSKTVPQNIKITEISKASGSRKGSSSPAVVIEGKVTPVKGLPVNPFETVSFFVLNINENHHLNSFLSNAMVRNIQFSETDKMYNFTIEANIDLSQIKQENTQVK